MSLQRPPGNPTLLKREVEILDRASSSILEATVALKKVGVDSTGEAVVALNMKANEIHTRMDAAWKRYHGTKGALHVYSIALEKAHSDANAAIQQESEGQNSYYDAERRIDAAEQEMRYAAQSGLDTGAADAERLAAIRSQSRAKDRIAAAKTKYTQAGEELDQAAWKAIASIDDSFDGTNDGFWDRVGAFFGAIGDWISSMAQWFTNFVKDVIGVIIDVLEVIAKAIAAALVFIVVLVCLAALLAPLLVLLYLLSPILLGVAVLALAAVATVITIAFVREVFGPPPTLVRTEEPMTSTGIIDRHPADEPYAALMQDLGELDSSCTTDLSTGEPRDPVDTEIRVVAINNEAGETIAWRVQIPSTGTWDPSTSRLNDLNTNVAHFFFPWVETKMEQAVFAAMTEAGVFDSDAPIMLAGFSQGGMTACEVAMDPRLRGRVESIVTAGSPVDQYQNELSGVRITSFTTNDIVSDLEGARHHLNDFGANPNFVQYYEPGGEHNAGYSKLDVPTGTYADMAQRFTDGVRPGDEQFFVGVGEGTVEVQYAYGYTR